MCSSSPVSTPGGGICISSHACDRDPHLQLQPDTAVNKQRWFTSSSSMKACPVPLLLLLLTTLLAPCLLVPTSTAFAPPPASFFGPASCSGSRRCLSSFPRPLSGDSSSSSSRNSSGRSSRSSGRVGRSSSSGDFSFGDLERELARRRAEERRAEEARAEQEREEAAAAAAEVEAAAAASRFSGLEEGDSFMEEQMVRIWSWWWVPLGNMCRNVERCGGNNVQRALNISPLVCPHNTTRNRYCIIQQ